MIKLLDANDVDSTTKFLHWIVLSLLLAPEFSIRLYSNQFNTKAM